MSKIFNRRPVFTEIQFERLSNIFDNAGQVIFAVAVLTPLISGFDKVNVWVVISGIVVTLSLWGSSVLLSKKG